MRASCIVILTLAASAAQASPCRWQDSEGWSSLTRKDKLVHFQRTWVCPPDAEGTLEIELFAMHGRKKVELESAKSDVKPKGKWERHKKVSARAFPGTFCAGKPKGKTKRVNRVYDHELHAAYPVKVRVEVTGTGDMAALAMTKEIEAYCRLCDRGGSSLSLKWGRAGASAVDKKAFYNLSVEKAKFACLKPGATLEMRYFLGDDRKQLERAIQPTVVDKGLERKFKAVKDRMVYDGKPPMAKLCRSGKSYVAYELGGKGELRHIDSSRRILPLRCN